MTAATDLVRPTCGCPHEEFVHRGATASIHADLGVPISAYLYDFDLAVGLPGLTMPQAKRRVVALIDGLLDS